MPKPQVTVFLPDAHFPYADLGVLALVLQEVKRLKPDRLVFTEWLDIQTMSKFPDIPKDARHDSLDPMLRECAEWMLRFREAARYCPTIYLEGNHEYRFYKWKSKTKEICRSELMDLKQFLCGPDGRTSRLTSRERRRILEMDFYSYGEPYVIQDLVMTHGEIIRRGAGASALAMILKYGKSVLMGHTHRLAITHHRTLAGTCWGYEAGFLGLYTQPYVMGVADWAQGFAIVEERPAITVKLVSIGGSCGPCTLRLPNN